MGGGDLAKPFRAPNPPPALQKHTFLMDGKLTCHCKSSALNPQSALMIGWTGRADTCRNVYAVKRGAWKRNNFNVNTAEFNQGLKWGAWHAAFTLVIAHVFNGKHTCGHVHTHRHTKKKAVQFLNLSHSCSGILDNRIHTAA